MSLYNFRVSEETFGELSTADLKIQIDESGPSGTLKMGKLLLAPNFQLKTSVELTNAVLVEERAQSKLKKPTQIKSSKKVED